MVANGHVTPADANIFADLGLPDAESLRVKAILMVEITRIWRESGLDQDKMAKRLGTTPARFSDIVKGRIAKCSITRMIDMLSAIDKHVALTINDVTCR
jgi:predicted XRE-type DNA-binding protein